jgi:tRNA 2-thiouridine synthesizing protein A
MNKDDHSENLDTRGRRCAMLSMMVAEKIEPMAPGNVLEVLTDDPGAPHEMPSWCQRTGHELVSLVQDGGDYRVRIRRGA